MKLFGRKEKETKEVDWSFERGLSKALISGLEEGVIVYDKSFKIISLNKAAEKIFNVKASEVEGRIFSLDRARSFKSKVMAQTMFSSLAPIVVRRSEPGAYPQILDVSLEDPDKELRILTNQVVVEGGRALGFVKIVRDRTRELGLLNAKSEFITIAAHQLRTPTTGLNWALDNLGKDKNITGESRETLSIARKTAKNLLKIINDLVNIAQIEEGKFGYQFKKINLTNFLGKVLSDAESVAKEYNVKLYFEQPKDKELLVKADTTRLALVISNLVDNAIKYNVANGQVIVKLRKLPSQPYVEVSIKDTGVGMSKESLSKLFTKFFRGKNVEKFAISGSGLGLYLAKNIIKKHGGKIWAKSVLNRGSTFYFTLPYA